MSLFTPEDLLLYLYKESSPELTAAVETALKEDWTLQEQVKALSASINHLEEEKITVAPRMEVVLKVLQYARETAPEAVHHD